MTSLYWEQFLRCPSSTSVFQPLVFSCLQGLNIFIEWYDLLFPDLFISRGGELNWGADFGTDLQVDVPGWSPLCGELCLSGIFNFPILSVLSIHSFLSSCPILMPLKVDGWFSILVRGLNLKLFDASSSSSKKALYPVPIVSSTWKMMSPSIYFFPILLHSTHWSSIDLIICNASRWQVRYGSYFLVQLFLSKRLVEEKEYRFCILMFCYWSLVVCFLTFWKPMYCFNFQIFLLAFVHIGQKGSLTLIWLVFYEFPSSYHSPEIFEGQAWSWTICLYYHLLSRLTLVFLTIRTIRRPSLGF